MRLVDVRDLNYRCVKRRLDFGDLYIVKHLHPLVHLKRRTVRGPLIHLNLMGVVRDDRESECVGIGLAQDSVDIVMSRPDAKIIGSRCGAAQGRDSEPPVQ